MANNAQNYCFSGLGTLTLIAPDAGPYFLSWKSTVPTGSQVVCTVNQNGSPLYVGPAGGEGSKVELLCATGDAITMVWTSSQDVDQPLNVIKHTISASEGI